MKIRRKYSVIGVLLVFLFPCFSYSALNKTYPTSATTQIRIDSYMDGITTLWKSTTTEFTKYEVDGSTTDFYLSTSTLEFIKLKLINEIADDAIEQYMVLPSTYAHGNWLGWCLTEINGNNVPINCP